MAISPNLTFKYQFSVEGDASGRWNGPGTGQASFGPGDGMAGPRPRFELCAGWLTLFPTDGWTQSLPTRWFSDIARPAQPLDSAARIAAVKAAGAEYVEAHKEALEQAAGRIVPGDFASYTKAVNEAMADVLRRRGMTRDLASYALFAGEALGKALQAGDELNFSRDANGDFRYSVVRNLETVFSAGSVGRVDDGGPMAIWQEYDRYPNPNAEEMRMKFPKFRIAEFCEVHKPCISVRVNSERFLMLDGQEVRVDPYYVFLARSNRNVPELAFEFTPRAVHSAGLLTTLGKDLIIDAAARLTGPVTRTL